MRKVLRYFWPAISYVGGIYALILAVTGPVFRWDESMSMVNSIYISLFFLIVAANLLGFLEFSLIKPWRVAAYTSGGVRMELANQFWTRRSALRFRQSLWGTPLALAASDIRIEKNGWWQ